MELRGNQRFATGLNVFFVKSVRSINQSATDGLTKL
jgi:hypothetical protein